jgi:quercetin dioxygenase-like cupin family protein
VEYWLDAAAAVADRNDGDTVSTRRLFDRARHCDAFSQRLLEFAPGRSLERADDEADDVLYVLGGEGTVTVGGIEHALGPGTAVFVPHGTAWTLETAEGSIILSVLVHDPVSGDGDEGPAVVDLRAAATQGATAGRQFALGVTPDVGCASVTQFVGFIPVGRAPDHFHTYDEVVYVLQGEGALHVDGETAPLSPGVCVHLPSRLVHCLENTGPGQMQVLGVFRPAGSPAEAYYPDGTRAQY